MTQINLKKKKEITISFRSYVEQKPTQFCRLETDSRYKDYRQILVKIIEEEAEKSGQETTKKKENEKE